MATILIVEDDVDIARGIAEFLEVQNHELDFAYNGNEAINLLKTSQYDLILLDLNLPYVDGLDVCRSLLSDFLTHVPVIIMSARSAEEDILKGFDCGAWDYLAKPFSFAELNARISVCLAKAKNFPALKPFTESSSARIDHQDMRFSFEGKSLQLHQLGFDLLKLLMERSPSVVKTSLIHRVLWDTNTPESDPLRANIYKLRKQLSEAFGQEFIQTVRGVGYKFIVEKK